MKAHHILPPLLAVISGCADPLDLGQLIERTRPLAVRVTVDGDETRAWPKPGESATARWLVVSPGGSPNLSWALAVCRAKDVHDGALRCRGEPLNVAESGLSAAPPTLSFTVPTAAELGDDAMLALYGVLCESGSPSLGRDASQSTCSGARDSEPLRVSADLFVGRGERTNHNPDLSDDRIEIDGKPWPPPDPASAVDTCATGVRISATARNHDIRVKLEGEDREPLERGESPVGDERETLQLSHFSTDGELSRHFSFVEADDETQHPAFEVEWTAPASGGVPGEGKVVRFHFVLRDGRGGTDFTVRELCLVP